MHTPTNTEKTTIFEGYQRLEYQHIADAHFRTMDSISAFFRYYLLLMGLPISATAVLVGFGLAEDITAALDLLRVPGIVVTAFFAAVGICVMTYVVNLRMDVILYARTANAIRKYFYDNSELSIDQQLSYRVLPQSKFLPEYHETLYFVPVVVTFGLINSLYLLALLHLALDISSSWIALSATLAFVFFHYVVYRWIAHVREKIYLKPASIGVDIDGVLNLHREHFSKWLHKKFGIQLDAEAIATIPVHEGHKNLSRDHEVAIFNDPSFWVNMPSNEDAVHVLRKMHNTLNLPIYFFTNRPWPENTGLTKTEKKANAKLWKTVSKKFLCQSKFPALSRLIFWVRVQFGVIKLSHAITRIWLSANGFSPHSVLFERKNGRFARFATPMSNRFYEARKRQIRFFVEDNPENANKLAPICDVVFLLDHPYNRDDENSNLSNVLRVFSWDEIYKKIRSLS